MQCGEVGKSRDPGGIGLKGRPVEQGQESGATVAPAQCPNGRDVGIVERDVQRLGALGIGAAKLALAQGGLGGDDRGKPPRGEQVRCRVYERGTGEPCRGNERHTRPLRQGWGQVQGRQGGKGLEDFALLGAQCRFCRGLHAGDEFMLLLPQDFLLEVVLKNLSLLTRSSDGEILGRLLFLDGCTHGGIVQVRSGDCPEVSK